MGPFCINIQAGHLPYQAGFESGSLPLRATQSSSLPRKLAAREQEDDGKEKKKRKNFCTYYGKHGVRAKQKLQVGFVFIPVLPFFSCICCIFQKQLSFFFFFFALCSHFKGCQVVGIIDIAQDIWRAETHNTIQSILGYCQCLYICSRPAPSLIDTIKGCISYTNPPPQKKQDTRKRISCHRY